MQTAKSLKSCVPRMARRFASTSVVAPGRSYLPPAEVLQRVTEALQSIKPCPTDINMESNFASDLKFDSMIRKEINARVADEFCVHISSDVSDSFINGAAIVEYIAKHPQAR